MLRFRSACVARSALLPETYPRHEPPGARWQIAVWGRAATTRKLAAAAVHALDRRLPAQGRDRRCAFRPDDAQGVAARFQSSRFHRAKALADYEDRQSPRARILYSMSR